MGSQNSQLTRGGPHVRDSAHGGTGSPRWLVLDWGEMARGADRDAMQATEAMWRRCGREMAS